MTWENCPQVEVIEGKHSGDPLMVGTRIPVSAIIENYDDFLEDGDTPDEALAETAECYPSAGIDAIRAVLEYREVSRMQPQQ